MDLPTGILRPKVKGGRSRRARRGGAEPTYFLGKFLSGKASTADIESAATAARLEVDDFYDNIAPHIYGIILDSYGPDKFAEVEEALEIAIERDLGDIARKLEAWKREIARRQAQSVSGLAALGRQGLGPRSNENTESKVAAFLTGIEKASLPQQMAALKKKATGNGGRRKTRRRKTRAAKKSRRTYK
jgi:hypothetical protein